MNIEDIKNYDDLTQHLPPELLQFKTAIHHLMDEVSGQILRNDSEMDKSVQGLFIISVLTSVLCKAVACLAESMDRDPEKLTHSIVQQFFLTQASREKGSDEPQSFST